MTDDRANGGQRDKARIDLRQDDDKRDWAKSLGVTEDELNDAVHAAGASPNKVRNYLQVRAFIDKLRDYVKRRKSAQRRG